MARTPHGGAFESRGRFFMRVTIAPHQRPAKLLPWANSLEQAQARATATQALVTRLREAGQSDFVEKLVDSAATGDDPKMSELTGVVERIVGGKVQSNRATCRRTARARSRSRSSPNAGPAASSRATTPTMSA